MEETIDGGNPAPAAPATVQETASKAELKRKRHAAAKNKEANNDLPISEPFRLIHRFKPPEKVQSYMMGTVGGKSKTFVTNVSVQMSRNFSKVMQQVLKEAQEGKFATRCEAVKRRDELVAETLAGPAGLVPLADQVIDVD